MRSQHAVPPFVDAHVHFWDHSIEGLRWRYLEKGFDHPRLQGMHRLDRPRFTGTELAAKAGKVELAGIVHIQSAEEIEPGLESAWLEKLAQVSGSPDAIVARARLAEPDIAVVVKSNARCNRVRGFRDMSTAMSIDDSSFVSGFNYVVDAGFSVEMLAPLNKHAQIGALADQRPDASIILGHAGLAEHRDEDYYKLWCTSLQELARRPNIVIKISALASGSDPYWTASSLRPWVIGCIEAFGSERSMFATNWPIDSLYGGYEALVMAYGAITANFSASERSDLFSDVARSVYGLD